MPLKYIAWLLFAVGVVYDLSTPDSENATAVLMGIAGLLVLILDELRRARP